MKLAEVANVIGDGDVILFRRARAWYSRLIRLWTRSVYSHVGMTCWVRSNAHNTLMLIEATFPRVRITPLEWLLRACQQDGISCDWWAIHDPAINRRSVANHLLERINDRYAPPWQFVWSWGWLSQRLRRLFGLRSDVDEWREFCSELVAGALRAGGYRPAEDDDAIPLEAAETDPGDLALYPCLRRMGVLTVDGGAGWPRLVG
jgi:hypothetical protein